ncbi:MAG TPA: hypothetical protein VFL41_07950 [Gaiellaceae bacterium]|nr:hypothetical protein [Gaiellaceae bacterium]
MTTAKILAIGVLATLVAGVGASSAARRAAPPWALHGRYAPTIHPADFVTMIDNRYFPLEPGTSFHYRGVKDGVPQTDDMVVTRKTATILGVKATGVRDTVSQHGKAIERTIDWYAQDKHGNVWYMGEDSFELQHGHFVRASDSWRGGIQGAKPGIIMRGDPQPGEVYRQEYYPPGQALDQARVISRAARLKVPYGSFKRVLVTVEWSPAEPQFEQKEYALGVGELEERVTQGGHESFELVSLTR